MSTWHNIQFPSNQNQNQNNMSFMTGAGGAALGMLGGAIGAGHQHRRQRELMDLQQQHQMALNRQGHQLQFDMWKKTSYPAQLAMMKQAGLSPGLMYGGGAGAGGSTGSQGGGSAAGGSAAAFQPMDMSNMMLMDAQRKVYEKQVDDLQSQIDKRDGVDTNLAKEQRKKIAEEVAEVTARIENLGKEKLRIIAETDRVVSEKERVDIETAIRKIDKEFFEQHDLAPSDFWMIKGLKRAGIDIYEGITWLLNMDQKQARDLLTGKGITGKERETFNQN